MIERLDRIDLYLSSIYHSVCPFAALQSTVAKYRAMLFAPVVIIHDAETLDDKVMGNEMVEPQSIASNLAVYDLLMDLRAEFDLLIGDKRTVSASGELGLAGWKGGNFIASPPGTNPWNEKMIEIARAPKADKLAKLHLDGLL